MTAPTGPEPMTTGKKECAMRAVVDRFEDRTHYPLDDLVPWRRDAERPHLAVGLGNVRPLGRLELETLVPKARDETGDGLVREAVERLSVHAWGHVSRIGPDLLVHDFVQVGLVE